MPDFLLKKTDIVPIKKTSSGGPINVSVSDIIAYGKNNNYGNSFVLYDCGNSRAGLAIRYFNVTTNTIYLATTTFLSDSSSYIGVGIYDNRYIQSPRTTLFGSTGSSISGFSVATNFLAQTVSGIQYGKNGGNLSGYGDQQAFYIDESVTTIYIDNVPYKETGTVRVNYYLPDYDYTYAKITYKKDDKPASETDGTSVEILKDQSSVDISGLEVGGNYWFTVFTDKSESEAFPFLIPELIDYGNMIFNDNSEITVINNNSSVTAITTPKFLVDTYKEKSTQNGYSYMNANANTWLIGPANKTTGYYHIFGWTLPTDKDVYIICQNNTGQNAYYVWIWWDGLTSRDMLGTNCGYSKWFIVSGSIIYYESGTALNNYSSFSNNLIVDGNRYWSQTGLGGDSSLKPIVWTEVSTSRIWVNGQKLT